LTIPSEASCNYYKYIAYLPDGIDRAQLKKELREVHGVGLSGEVYELPLNRQPVFEEWVDSDLPGAEHICARHICLPISAVITDEQAGIVLSSLDAALRSLS